MSASWWASFPTSPPLDFEAGIRFEKRKNTIKNKLFIDACGLALVDPTPRQARKWNNGQGRAIAKRSEAQAHQ